MKLLSMSLLLILSLLSACSSYQYARNVRFMALTNKANEGSSVGLVKGSDCTWWFFDNPLGDPPSLERAVISAQTQKGYHSFNRGSASDSHKSNTIRYLNNVRSENSDSNYWIVKKQCLIVKGQGFK
jgi:hypothetical protein